MDCRAQGQGERQAQPQTQSREEGVQAPAVQFYLFADELEWQF